MSIDFQECFMLKKGEDEKTDISLLEWKKDKSKFGKNLYLVLSPFTDYRTGINFRKGDFFTISEEDDDYLIQYSDFVKELSDNEQNKYVEFQLQKSRSMKFKIPKIVKSKTGISFPLTFKAIDLIGDWKKVEVEINQDKKDRKAFSRKNSYFQRRKLEMELLELKQENIKLKEKNENELADLKKELASIKKAIKK